MSENNLKKYLEAGEIVSTHGVHGTLRVKPWSDDPGFLCGFERLYIDSREYKVSAATVHKSLVLLTLEGVDTLDKAIAYKGKTVFIDREDARLEEGRYFVQDLLGMEVVDVGRGSIGRLTDVLDLPAGNVYVVEGEHKYMIPAVDEFVKGVDMEKRTISVKMIEGMSDAD